MRLVLCQHLIRPRNGLLLYRMPLRGMGYWDRVKQLVRDDSKVATIMDEMETKKFEEEGDEQWRPTKWERLSRFFMAWPRYKDTKEVMQEALVEKQLEQLKEDEIRLKQLEALARRATPVVDKIPESGPLREWMDKFLEEEVDHKGRHYPGSRHFKEDVQTAEILVEREKFIDKEAIKKREAARLARAEKILQAERLHESKLLKMGIQPGSKDAERLLRRQGRLRILEKLDEAASKKLSTESGFEPEDPDVKRLTLKDELDKQIQRTIDEDPNRLTNRLKKYFDNPTRRAYYKTYWELTDELNALRRDYAAELKARDEDIVRARAAKKLLEKDPSIKSTRQALEMAEEELMESQEAGESSTALVVKPMSRWEQFKSSVNFSPKRSKLYQRTMELKEKLEESDNPIIARAMNAVGAAEDILGSARKVVAPEKPKKGLDLLKEAIPNFNPFEFYVNLVLQLRPIINAFNEGDREFIFDMAAPERYPYLEQKMKEMRKSVLDPTKEYESFIMRYPDKPHILAVSIDDPQKPTLLIKFKVKKTAEEVLTQKQKEELEAKATAQKEHRKSHAGDGGGDHDEEQDEVTDVSGQKVVVSKYVVAFQFNPEVQEWQLYDFHEAKMDVSFFG